MNTGPCMQAHECTRNEDSLVVQTARSGVPRNSDAGQPPLFRQRQDVGSAFYLLFELPNSTEQQKKATLLR